MTENTENMSPLLFQSSEEPDEYDQDGQFQNTYNDSNVNPTLLNPINQPCMIPTQNDITESNESVKISTFLKSSSEVEIIPCGQRSPIILSSEVTEKYKNNIHLSPDLFSSQDDGNDNYELGDPPQNHPNSRKFENIKVSTPHFQVKAKKENLSDDLFEEDIAPNSNDTNVFEITTNDEFPNMIRINSDTEMSPIRVTPEASPDRLDDDCLKAISTDKVEKNFSFFFEKNPNKSIILNDPIINLENSLEFIDEYRETPKSSKRVSPKTSSSHRTPSTSSKSSGTPITPNSGKWLRKRDHIDDKVAWRESVKRRNLQKSWFGNEELMKKLENSSVLELKKHRSNLTVEVDLKSLTVTNAKTNPNTRQRIARKSRSLWSSDDEF